MIKINKKKFAEFAKSKGLLLSKEMNLGYKSIAERQIPLRGQNNLKQSDMSNLIPNLVDDH